MTDRYGVFHKDRRIATAYVQPSTDDWTQFTVSVWPLDHRIQSIDGAVEVEFERRAESIFKPFLAPTSHIDAVRETLLQVLKHPRSLELLPVKKL